MPPQCCVIAAPGAQGPPDYCCRVCYLPCPKYRFGAAGTPKAVFVGPGAVSSDPAPAAPGRLL